MTQHGHFSDVIGSVGLTVLSFMGYLFDFSGIDANILTPALHILQGIAAVLAIRAALRYKKDRKG